MAGSCAVALAGGGIASGLEMHSPWIAIGGVVSGMALAISEYNMLRDPSSES
jgi:hypothetical protein